MGTAQRFLAFDLGAESGRGVLGCFDGAKLKLEELHRFPNGGIRVLDSLHWNVLQLWNEMKAALSACAQRDIELAGIGVDTWGVDFALLGRGDELLGLPYHYRDARTDRMLEEAFQRLPRSTIFERSGCQFLQINTLYQLLSMVVHKSPLLDVAETFLMIPDLFNFWLTGRKVCEFTNATTTQFYDPRRQRWSTEICDAIGVCSEILPEIVQPGDEAWHAAAIRCSRNGAARNTGYRASLPRYRFSSRRSASRERQLGVYQFRYMVTDGNRSFSTNRHRSGTHAQFY